MAVSCCRICDDSKGRVIVYIFDGLVIGIGGEICVPVSGVGLASDSLIEFIIENEIAGAGEMQTRLAPLHPNTLENPSAPPYNGSRNRRTRNKFTPQQKSKSPAVRQ